MIKNKVYHGDNLEVMRTFQENTFDSIVTDPPYGISFMGNHWDYDVPDVARFKEMYRILKPGGHILVACGTRTQHRMAVNIEDAGFEIRDIIAWIYYNGFPKSADISKRIDSYFGVEREIISVNPNAIGRKDNSGRFQPKVDSEERTEPRESYITRPETPPAKEWEGWGTHLKPAMELWTLARKPKEGSIEENVLKWGTGGLNIDGCRMETDNIKVNVGFKEEKQSDGWGVRKTQVETQNAGRFPSNVIIDGSDSVISCLSEEARKIFYCPKPSQSEKNNGLYDFESKETRGGGGRAEQGYDDNDDEQQRLKDAARKFGAVQTKKQNIHPTVKPIDLMRYLVRLITPKGGLCLDPYLGSGTTAIACKQEKMDYVGIERESEYVEIAEARIKAADVRYDIFDFL